MLSHKNNITGCYNYFVLRAKYNQNARTITIIRAGLMLSKNQSIIA